MKDSYSTYEVFIDVHSYTKHNEENERKDSTCYKLVHTGNDDQMIADALREFAGKIAISLDAIKTENDIFAVLNKIRARTKTEDKKLVCSTLNEVAKELKMEWWGYGA